MTSLANSTSDTIIVARCFSVCPLFELIAWAPKIVALVTVSLWWRCERGRCVRLWHDLPRGFLTCGFRVTVLTR